MRSLFFAASTMATPSAALCDSGFSAHVFARSDGVNHNLFVPVVGHRHDDGVHALVVQQLFIAARRADRFSGDFLRQLMPPVVEVAGRYALHAGKRDAMSWRTATSLNAHE